MRDHDKTASAAPAVTDEMLERALTEWFGEPIWRRGCSNGVVESAEKTMRAALKAALSARGPVASAEVDRMAAALAFTALDTADRLIERAYGVDKPAEWTAEYEAVASARAMIAAAGEKPAAPAVWEKWSYSINYGPDGEENWANLLTPEGDHVANIRTHHAKRIVAALSAPPAVAELRAEIERVKRRATMLEKSAGFATDDVARLENALKATEARLSQAVMALVLCAKPYNGEDGHRRLIPLSELGAELRKRQEIARTTLRTIQGGGE